MDQMSTPVRLLYYLNLKSRKLSALEIISADVDAMRYFIEVCNESRGTATAQQTSKKIMKIIKQAADYAAICL